MSETAVIIISSILGSTGLFTLIQTLLARYDAKKGKTAQIAAKLEKLEKAAEKSERDTVRTQMMMLMHDFHEGDGQELFTIAEHYFSDLDGNWYMTSLFNKFIKEHDLAQPEWLQARDGKENNKK